MSDFGVHFYESIDDLTPVAIRRWRDLEMRALEPNAYLSPRFVLPAIKHLSPEKKLLIVILNKKIAEEVVTLAVGVFEQKSWSKKFPFKHLRTYASTHSFLTGIFCDKCCVDDVTARLLSEIKSRKQWGAVLIGHNTHYYDPEKKSCLLFRGRGIRWHEENEWIRSVLHPKQAGEDALKQVLSKQRYKNIKRKSRQLNNMGDYQWRYTAGKDITDTMISDFLALENTGWKKESAKSLASSSQGEAFFLDMSREFCLDDSAFVTEILLDDEVIASTFNFISCGAGFAFKLGWNESFAKQSIGLLNECELVATAPEHLGHLSFIDSGGEPGSFMDDLWPGRHRLVSGFYSFNRCVSAYLLLLNVARKVSAWRSLSDKSR